MCCFSLLRFDPRFVHNRDKLNDHLDKKHRGIKQKHITEKIPCLFSDCRAELTMDSLVQHLRRTHYVHKVDERTGEPIVDPTKANPYVCTCRKQFPFPVLLEKHQQKANAKEPSEHLIDPRSRVSASSKIAKPIRKEHIQKLLAYLQSGHEILDLDRDPPQRVKNFSFAVASSASTGDLPSDMLDTTHRFPYKALSSLQSLPSSSSQHYNDDVEEHDNAAVDSSYLARPVLEPHQLVPPSDPFLNSGV